jgi:hypothetical protein
MRELRDCFFSRPGGQGVDPPTRRRAVDAQGLRIYGAYPESSVARSLASHRSTFCAVDAQLTSLSLPGSTSPLSTGILVPLPFVRGMAPSPAPLFISIIRFGDCRCEAGWPQITQLSEHGNSGAPSAGPPRLPRSGVGPPLHGGWAGRSGPRPTLMMSVAVSLRSAGRGVRHHATGRGGTQLRRPLSFPDQPMPPSWLTALKTA